jgi:hypothetical protein
VLAAPETNFTLIPTSVIVTPSRSVRTPVFAPPDQLPGDTSRFRGKHPVGLEYRMACPTCRFGCLVGSCRRLVLAGEPSRIGLRRTLWSARLITRGGWVSAWAGASCPSVRCGRAVLKWCR